MENLQERIEMVKSDILNRFPNCSYTVGVLLWDDNTSRVECRHGNDEGTKIYTSTYYNSELTFNEIDVGVRSVGNEVLPITVVVLNSYVLPLTLL